jgi:hypothetical protein
MKVTDEAVEAVSVSLIGEAWATFDEGLRNTLRGIHREALEAALPHLEGATPAIDREAIAKALFDHDNRNPLVHRDWSRAMKLERADYLGRADAVLALIGSAP